MAFRRSNDFRARWTVGRLLAAGYILALLALAVIGASAYLRIGSLLEDRAPVEHTYRVLSGIDGLQGRLKDAERGQRGYVITGDERYLQPYRRSLTAIAGGLDLLGSLTSDNPHQQAMLAQVRVPVRDKLAELAETIELRRTRGLEAASRVVRIPPEARTTVLGWGRVASQTTIAVGSTRCPMSIPTVIKGSMSQSPDRRPDQYLHAGMPTIERPSTGTYILG